MTKVNRLLKIICIIIPLTYALTAVAQQESTAIGSGIPLPGLLNTANSVEINPSLTADGQTIIIKSNRDGSWKLYESVLMEDDTWSAPRALENINSHSDSTDLIGQVSISYGGGLLFFAASYRDAIGGSDIYVSEKNGDTWGTPENIGHPINSSGNEDSPSLSPDGNTLYFTRLKSTENVDLDRNFDKTCYEIFSSHKNADGSWSQPEPLPYPVNFKCDRMPRILSDNQTLIFSSHRSDDQEGYEVYQSRSIGIGGWSDPVPVSFMNSITDDHYVSVTAQGDKLYYSAQGDIKFSDIPENFRPSAAGVVTGYITDQDKENNLEVTINVKEAETYEELFTVNNNPGNGKYSVVLPRRGVFNLEFTKENYSTRIHAIDLTPMDQYELIEKDVSLFSTVHATISVLDDELFMPLPASLTVIKEKDSSQVIESIIIPEKEHLDLELPLGDKYIVYTMLKNFKSDTTLLDLSGILQYNTIRKSVYLSPVKVDVPVHVSDASTLEEAEGKVIIKNLNRDERFEINANEMTALRVGDQYEIRTSTRNQYFYESIRIDVGSDGIVLLDEPTESVSVAGNQLEFKLTPIGVNTTLILDGVNFQDQSERFTYSTYSELDKLIGLLKENPTMRIEIGVHTDNSGSEKYNLDLSGRRAHCIKDYLVMNEIEKDRLQVRGYGAVRPVLPNNSRENRAKNRRVELRILEILN